MTLTTQNTIDKLIEMRLTFMSDAFRSRWRVKEEGKFFENCFGMLVDSEYNTAIIEATV